MTRSTAVRAYIVYTLCYTNARVLIYVRVRRDLSVYVRTDVRNSHWFYNNRTHRYTFTFYGNAHGE